jgi:hypothetical protein
MAASVARIGRPHTRESLSVPADQWESLRERSARSAACTNRPMGEPAPTDQLQRLLLADGLRIGRPVLEKLVLGAGLGRPAAAAGGRVRRVQGLGDRPSLSTSRERVASERPAGTDFWSNLHLSWVALVKPASQGSLTGRDYRQGCSKKASRSELLKVVRASAGTCATAGTWFKVADGRWFKVAALFLTYSKLESRSSER